MELYQQADSIPVIGIQVTGFPNGITAAFESLMKTLGNSRDYYGISWMDENDTIIYYAMAAAAFAGEGKPYHYESLTIEKGEYHTETIHNWLSKLDCIKDVFAGLMENNKPGKNHPCIEWYRSKEEMLCMVKV